MKLGLMLGYWIGDFADPIDTVLEAESLAVVPGTAFGPSGEGHVRASYAVDFDVLDRALECLERFLSGL